MKRQEQTESRGLRLNIESKRKVLKYMDILIQKYDMDNFDIQCLWVIHDESRINGIRSGQSEYEYKESMEKCKSEMEELGQLGMESK